MCICAYVSEHKSVRMCVCVYIYRYMYVYVHDDLRIDTNYSLSLIATLRLTTHAYSITEPDCIYEYDYTGHRQANYLETILKHSSLSSGSSSALIVIVLRGYIKKSYVLGTQTLYRRNPNPKP